MDIPVFHDDQHGTAVISHAVRADAIVATGRSDYANQVNECWVSPICFAGL